MFLRKGTHYSSLTEVLIQFRANRPRPGQGRPPVSKNQVRNAGQPGGRHARRQTVPVRDAGPAEPTRRFQSGAELGSRIEEVTLQHFRLIASEKSKAALTVDAIGYSRALAVRAGAAEKYA